VVLDLLKQQLIASSILIYSLINQLTTIIMVTSEILTTIRSSI